MALPIFLCDDDSVLVQYYKSVIENWIMINDYDMELIFATTDPDDIFLYLKKIVLPIVYSFWILISVRILTASILLNKLEGITSSHKLSLLLHIRN